MANQTVFSTVRIEWTRWTKVGGFIAGTPGSTSWIWTLHAECHNFRAHDSRLHMLCARVFASHFGHLSLVFAWLAGMYLAGARFSNYLSWLDEPDHVLPGAQPVPRTVPFIPSIAQDAPNADVGGGMLSIQITSGLFQVWRAHGYTSTAQLFATAMVSCLLAVLCLLAGWFHFHQAVPTLEWFSNTESALNHHLAGLLGLGSLAWAGHLIHVSRPISALLSIGVDPQLMPPVWEIVRSSEWLQLTAPGFTLTNFFTLNWAALSNGLTILGGLDCTNGGLWLSDVAHHHVAIGVIFILAGHLYKTDFGLGLTVSELLASHNVELVNSWNLQLALQLAIQGSLSIWFGHLIVAFPAYPHLATDYPTSLSLFTHHQWIGGIFIVGAAAHASLTLLYDCDLRRLPQLPKILGHTRTLIVHLNWL